MGDELIARAPAFRRRRWGWPLAASFVCAATVAGELLPNGSEVSTGLYVLAIVGAALVGGRLVAAVTTVAAGLAEWWFFLDPPHSFRPPGDRSDLVAPATLFAAGAILSAVADAIQRARWKAEADARRLTALNHLAVALGDIDTGGPDEVAAVVTRALGAVDVRIDRDATTAVLGPTEDSRAEDSHRATPIPGRGGAIGTLRVEFAEPAAEPSVGPFLSAVAAQCGSTIERLELRDAERRALEADAFLANATKVLTGALESEAVIEAVRKLVVPHLAETCTVEFEPDESEPRPDELRIPLRSRQRSIATLVCTRHDRPFDDPDRGLAEELAARAAQALDVALAYEDQARSSTTLQRSLLPQALVSVPDLAVAARYVAATAAHEVGGDFYDVIAKPDGGAVMIIGDVQGKGMEAATLTAVARHTLRTAALEGDHPAQMLHRLNHALLYGQAEAAASDADEDPRFVTAAVVEFTRTPTGFHAVAASGGHPPPLLVRAGGSVEELLSRGMVLGVVAKPVFRELEADLTLADTIVLYTDGATEQSHRGDFDEQKLGQLVRHRLGPADAEAVAQLILDTVLQMAPGQPRDDLAVVVACVTGPR